MKRRNSSSNNNHKPPIFKSEAQIKSNRIPPVHPLSAKSNKIFQIEAKKEERPRSVSNRPNLPLSETPADLDHTKSVSQNLQVKRMLNMNTVSINPPKSKTPLNRFLYKPLSPRNVDRSFSNENKGLLDKENSDIENFKQQLKKLTRRTERETSKKRFGKIPMVKLVDSLFNVKKTYR